MQMKQRNMALMAVAVAFGLVAAFVTSKMTSSQASTPDTVRVLVAKATIPLGTLIDEKNIDNFVEQKDLLKDTYPLDAFTDPKALIGKKIARMKTAKTPFTPFDVSDAPDVPCPAGYKRLAIKTSIAQAVSGFISPGSKVDIIGLEKIKHLNANGIPTGIDHTYPRRLMRDALVLSVDDKERKEGQGGVPQLNTITIAVKDKDIQLLELFKDSQLSLALRDSNQTYSDEKVAKFDISIDDMPGFKGKDEEVKVEASPVVKYDTVWIAKKTLKQNDKITEENLGELFETIEVAGKLPGKMIKNGSDLKGKFLATDVVAGSWVLEDTLSDKEVAKTPVTELAPVVARKQFKRYWRVGELVGYDTFEDDGNGGWVLVDKTSLQTPTSVEAPKPSDKGNDKGQPQNLDGSKKERVTLR
jgi:Flp pilus assembly protein CpaB